MADAELKDPDRPALIEKVVDLLNKDGSHLLPCTFKASLWLCQIDNLRQIVADLEADPTSAEEGEYRKRHVRRLHAALGSLQNTIFKPCKLIFRSLVPSRYVLH